MIGTGIYIDDIEREYKAGAMLLGGISAALLVLLSLIGWQISVSILRSWAENRRPLARSCSGLPVAT